LLSPAPKNNDDGNAPNRTIKIGYFGDLSGPTFNFGQSAINGVLMAADEINQLVALAATASTS
jgi:ABC-type branched-subunit amino acid transport system substrate-binding protein